MSSKPITTNAMAREEGREAQKYKTAKAIVAQRAAIQDRIHSTSREDIKLAWIVAIIELEELARTLEL
jgi:hypothetical protein